MRRNNTHGGQYPRKIAEPVAAIACGLFLVALLRLVVIIAAQGLLHVELHVQIRKRAPRKRNGILTPQSSSSSSSRSVSKAPMMMSSSS